ncbi:MAG: 16S rRNA (cytidine(1402)-2'-O)-methyltransferase [Gemmatimonadetes bacterium]|nr:16S rRNA (cytidine(1402)-2'-O)-methyltransferase [Gemmatimonadota bacterium]MYG86722.1 16S rRNA (cytidine(1402)-2'-O)-methyltransferase [Gemmatimonadota bacterium]MYJ88511.1 16S rRNA (cytidine(1402)-2'-O)-methyltransferase [Gemmatimonadota bacterium]
MLYLVATPIGHLDDITLRALEILRGVDTVLSEDTRRTGRLLKHYGISARQMSYHEHNEQRAVPRALAALEQGRDLALVTDAGTPGIADPGYRLVQAAIQAEIPVSMAPGPSALIMALVLSGLPVHRFSFCGFPPRRPAARRRCLEADADRADTLIYFESPHRVHALIADALEAFGDRRAALANDLTKLHEKIDRSPLSVLLEDTRDRRLRGEFILLVEGRSG